MIGKASADIIDTGLGGPKKQFIAGLLLVSGATSSYLLFAQTKQLGALARFKVF